MKYSCGEENVLDVFFVCFFGICMHIHYFFLKFKVSKVCFLKKCILLFCKDVKLTEKTFTGLNNYLFQINVVLFKLSIHHKSCKNV